MTNAELHIFCEILEDGYFEDTDHKFGPTIYKLLSENKIVTLTQALGKKKYDSDEYFVIPGNPERVGYRDGYHGTIEVAKNSVRRNQV